MAKSRMWARKWRKSVRAEGRGEYERRDSGNAPIESGEIQTRAKSLAGQAAGRRLCSEAPREPSKSLQAESHGLTVLSDCEKNNKG